VHQPRGAGIVRADHPVDQRPLGRPLDAHQPREEPARRALHHDPALREHEAELRPLAGQPDVHRERHRDADADRRAVDRGDQGLGGGEQAQGELTTTVPPARRVVPGVERVRTGQVHPGAERPTRPVTTTARTSSSASRSSSAATSWSFIATV
jgi:hypothetical protein